MSDLPKDMIFIPMRTKPDGTVVAAHWRRQKRALTPEQKREKERLALVERAKREQANENFPFPEPPWPNQ